ncbi:MAG: hypothetical protein MUO40_07965 [Anaerolineaceae bacterium]|nr:hypothetical protein [Anaerolineaceae bacterium]
MKTFPNNEDCPLTNEEQDALRILLDNLEWKAIRPFKHLTSTYTDSVVDGYDEFEIEVTITWGVDGQWEDFNYVSIDRKKLTL